MIKKSLKQMMEPEKQTQKKKLEYLEPLESLVSVPMEKKSLQQIETF